VGTAADQGVGALEVLIGGQVGNSAPGGRLEQVRHQGLDRDQRQQRHEGWLEDDDRSDRHSLAELTDDEEPTPFHSVGDHTDEGTEQRRGEVSGQKQECDGAAGAHFVSDVEDQRHQAHRVAQEGHDAGEPEPTEPSVVVEQPPRRAASHVTPVILAVCSGLQPGARSTTARQRSGPPR
jgi:hypothetical protein